jgi:RNA polymerase sigma factor (sigma-70 family)
MCDTNERAILLQIVETERHRLNLDQPGLTELIEPERIALKAESILDLEGTWLQPEDNSGRGEAVRKAVGRAVSSEIYDILRQAKSPLLLTWLNNYLTVGLSRISYKAAKFEDAVQEGLHLILEKLETVKYPESFLFWALQIARNALKGYYRKESNSVKIKERLAVECDAELPDLEQLYLKQELREILLYHISSLRKTKNTRLHQQILVAFYFRGYSIEQLAQALGLPNQRVSHLLDEAHKRLRNDPQLISQLAGWKCEPGNRKPASNFSP